jgi:capsid protein
MWLKSFLGLAVSGNYPAEKFPKFAEHEFRGRRWMWVDPMKDMNAAETAVLRGWKTNAQVAADMGTDFDDNIEELKREKELAGGILAEPKQPTKVTNEQEKPDDEEK